MLYEALNDLHGPLFLSGTDIIMWTPGLCNCVILYNTFSPPEMMFVDGVYTLLPGISYVLLLSETVSYLLSTMWIRQNFNC